MTVTWPSVRTLGLATIGVSLLAIITACVLRSRLSASGNLEEVPKLLASRRFDEAERLLGSYLRYHPDSAEANLMMAQSCLAREDQKPRQALDQLARIRTTHHAVRAMILLNEGKAYSSLGWNERAESAWKEALRLEPGAPEVGWDLLGLYYVQGRREDARRLGLTLFAIEPDPRDRAQLLLELVRQDAQPISPDSLIRTLEPIVQANPDDHRTATALGLALVRNSRFDDGLKILQVQIARSPEKAEVWDALLLALDEAGKLDELTDALERLPAAIAGDAQFERYRGAAAQHRQDWSHAADAYFNAWRADPSNSHLLYRLDRALRAAGRAADAREFDLRVRGAQKARDEILPLYDEANAVKDLGIAPHTDLYHRLGDLRERMGRYDEAIAWHRLVLRDQPDDRVSRTSIDRLSSIVSATKPPQARVPDSKD